MQNLVLSDYEITNFDENKNYIVCSTFNFFTHFDTKIQIESDF